MSTIFAQIVAGELPCHKVAENDEFLAFLDIFPLKKGHTLVIPKKVVDELFELEDEVLARMMVFSKQIAQKLKQHFECKRIGVTVIGFDVPHAHIHLIPINHTEDMDFTRPKLQVSSAELAKLAEELFVA